MLRDYKFYNMSHFKSIETKSLHYIIDKVLKFFNSNTFPYKVFYPIYLSPEISRKYK